MQLSSGGPMMGVCSAVAFPVKNASAANARSVRSLAMGPPVRRAMTAKKAKAPAKTSEPSSKHDTSATRASPASTGKPNSSVRSSSCKKPTIGTNSSKTSGPASTSSVRDLSPFWTKYTADLSRLWSFRTETGCVDSDLGWSTGSSQRLAQNSWFTVKCHKAQQPPPMPPIVDLSDILAPISPMTPSPSFPSLWHETMADARQQTAAKESVVEMAQIKALLRKQKMASAQQEKKRKRATTINDTTETEEKMQDTESKRNARHEAESELAIARAEEWDHARIMEFEARVAALQPIRVEDEEKKENLPSARIKKSKTRQNAKDTNQSHGHAMDEDDAGDAVQLNVQPDPPAIAMKEPPCRTIRYRLHPTDEQMVRLRKAFGVTTWTYNQCLAAIQKKAIPKTTISACRAYALNANALLLQDKPWVTEVPYDIRDEAAQDLIRAFKATETKVAKGDVFAAKAQYKFQSKYRKSKKLVIHSKHYKSAGVFWPSFFGSKPFRCNEGLPATIAYSANLTLNWLGQVHLHVPRPLQKRATNPATKPVAAIDPGVRTFGTVFDPEANQYIEWGKGDMSILFEIGLKMDRLKSRMDQAKGKGKGHSNVGHRKRYRLKRVFRRLAFKIQNMVKDFHYRFAHWLCQNYKVILLPYYEVSKMVPRRNRKIRCKTVRGMLTWSSCLFRDRLMGVSRRYPDSHIIQLSEAYTTKTCRCCGFQHKTIGGSEVFKCPSPSCKVVYGRDDGGASNILMRYLTLLHEDLTLSAPSVQSTSHVAASTAR